MNYRLIFLLFGLIISAITFVLFAAWRRPTRLLALLTAFSLSASAQNWTPFLDNSRAVDWSGVTFSIPAYSANCAKQPTLLTGSGNASANTTAIQQALASCDATHNVVSIPAGNYFIAGITFPDHGNQVLRGAGAGSTTLTLTAGAGCNGESAGICMYNSGSIYAGNPAALPPGGTQQCSWTAGYAQNTTSITLSSCGGTPPLNGLIILDQANDTSDTGGVYICDSSVASCTYNGSPSNHDGRIVSGVTHSQQQVAYITKVASVGSGSYTVTISPGVYFTNIRSGQAPGAWWSASAQHDGLENLKIDGTNTSSLYNVAMYGCYQCWVKGVASTYGPRAHVLIYLGQQDVVRDSYFYQAQAVGSDSYGIEIEQSSASLLENNIFQQTTAPIMYGQASGAVAGYNFSIDNQFPNNYLNPAYGGHNAGNEMNLWEGNSFQGIWTDDSWGSSAQQTVFRNMLIGWAIGRTNSTFPVMERSFTRNFNFIGNVLGQPGYHTTYQSYATSASGGVNQAQENMSIYSLGWGNTGADCTSTPACDPRTFSTLMRWGNYDTVTAGVKWDSTEASPTAAPYVNANLSSGLFATLTHTLPASLYYKSTPSWWPSGKAWPPIGPDVTTGNVGICSGTYSGAQGVNSSQCGGGTLSAAWASHVTSIPSQDCFLNVMHGPPDGSGSMLSFDASQCYTSSGTTTGTGLGSPTDLTATVN